MNEKQIGIKISTTLSGKSTKQLKDYADQLSRIQAFSKGIDKGTLQQIDETNKSVEKVNKSLNETSNITGSAFKLTSLASFGYAMKSLIKTLGNFTNKSAEYTENINLYKVAFNGATDEADAFVDKLTEMYGLDESWLVRTTGLFKQLSNAMSLSEEQGTKLAKLMTQMSIDMSSLYNLDIERASSVLQSSLAGQTKPIRHATGGDITQPTLQPTLDNLGIEKAVTQLSFAEKRLLIIISLTEQLGKMTNDFGKTIESPANQTRILSEQWARLTRAVGNVFMPIVAKVLPYLNAILMVLTEIINLVATLFGFKLEDFDYGVAGLSDSFLEMEENIDGATNSVKKLKHGLRGFDKLNVITTPSSSGSDSGAGGGIDPEIMDAFNKAFDEYQSKLENVTMKATKIRDSIMEWLGFTKQIDKETGKVSWKFEKITGGTMLGALGVGGTIFVGVTKIFKMFKKIADFTGLTKIFVSIAKFLGSITGISTLVEGIGVLFAGAGTFSEVLSVYFLPFLQQLGGVGAIIGGIIRSIQGVISLLDESKSKFDGIIKVIEGIALIVGGVSLLIGAWPVAIGAGIVALVAFITEAVVKNWDAIKEFFVNVYESFKEKIIDPIMKFLTPIANVIYKLAIKPVIDFFKPVLETAISIILTIYENIKEIVVGIGKAIWSIVEKVIEIGAKIVEIFIALGKAGYTYIIKPFAEWIANGLVYVYDHFIKPLLNLLGSLASWIYNNVITPIWNNILWIRDKIYGVFKVIGTAIADFIGGAIKTVINGVLYTIEKNINNFIKLLNGAIKLINKIPGVNITTVQELKIPRLEKGMDFVPKDFYGPVFLDYGERVLTKQENREYSQQKGMFDNASSGINGNTSFNPTFIIQVGSKEVAREVLSDLQGMAKSDGKPIIIQG